MAAMAVRAPVTPYMMALQEKCLRGTMYGSVRPNLDFPALVELYLQGRLKIDELVSRTYRLEQINVEITWTVPAYDYDLRYDEMGRLWQILLHDSYAQFQYSYDAASNPTQRYRWQIHGALRS